MRKIGVYFAPANQRSRIIAGAMAAGIRVCKDQAIMRPATTYKGKVEFDAAVFYGLGSTLPRVFADYRRKGRAVYIDLGYWERKKKTRHDGNHKVVLNNRHPTAYFQDTKHSPARFDRLNLTIEPWREEGDHILVAGMSAKAAYAEGITPNSWERRTIAKLRTLTKRPIIYRPKPNWQRAVPIAGSTFDKETPLHEALRGCHAVVTHHSNVAVDALLAGVPVFCEEGAASVMSPDGLASIERPLMPVGRKQFFADLAYCQWSVAEMANGRCWAHLVREGLIK